jgi:hypothetical protein
MLELGEESENSFDEFASFARLFFNLAKLPQKRILQQKIHKQMIGSIVGFRNEKNLFPETHSLIL